MATSKKDQNFLGWLRRNRKEVVVGMLILLAIVFLVKNSDPVEFDLIFWKVEAPLIVLLLLFALLGAGIVGIYWVLSNREKKHLIRALKREVEKLEADLDKPKPYSSDEQKTRRDNSGSNSDSDDQ